MNKSWLLGILALSLLLLGILKNHELKSLKPYFKAERVLKLKHFEEAKLRLKKEDREIFKLWESILTGRAAPLSRLMKEHYQQLGLNHLFTPSGFHLSAVLVPFMKLLKARYHLWLLALLGCRLLFLPGLGALKRMLLIKAHQKKLGMKLGFSIALLADVLFGSFQTSALSFTYSFLFLGIIYSGLTGIGLIVWFFIAQIILAYFQNADISLLLLFFSPLLNSLFALVMPLLFILAYPLWDWQVLIGITLLRWLQDLVELCSSLSFQFPLLEVNIVLLIIVALFLWKRFKLLLPLSFIFCSSLNLDRARIPGSPANEFVPRGQYLETIYEDKEVKVRFADGTCKMKLIRGYWWENCSPSKKRSRIKKRFKRLSYPS